MPAHPSLVSAKNTKNAYETRRYPPRQCRRRVPCELLRMCASMRGREGVGEDLAGKQALPDELTVAPSRARLMQRHGVRAGGARINVAVVMMPMSTTRSARCSTMQATLFDHRRYFFTEPVTFAFRALNVARRGIDVESPRAR